MVIIGNGESNKQSRIGLATQRLTVEDKIRGNAECQKGYDFAPSVYQELSSGVDCGSATVNCRSTSWAASIASTERQSQ